MNELIASNQMNVADEETVFRSVVKWVRHDEAERKQHVAEVSPVPGGEGKKCSGKNEHLTDKIVIRFEEVGVYNCPLCDIYALN